MPVAPATDQPTAGTPVTSFAKSLFLGEIHDDLVFPFPEPDPDERVKVGALTRSLRDFASQAIDPHVIEDNRWIGDDVIRGLGERGLTGLYVPEQYGGQGLSQSGYCHVCEVFAQIDPTLAVVMGVHQSIGMKGIVLFGTEDQKERFLPDLAAGRKLAGFALTEPHAGSDAYHLHSRATRQADGSWTLNGEKRFIGNGGKGSVFVTFARTEINGEDRHTAFILEKGMPGFEVGERFDTLGLRGNDLRRLYYKDVRIPPENVLGEPGDGFRLAMQILNNGRLGTGTGTVGLGKFLLAKAIEHVEQREQFGHPLGDFELVRDKIAWMIVSLFGLESAAYMTTGLVDRHVPDYSLESAICKVQGTEFLWYAVNRALQLKGGEGYMRDQPYEKVLRDARIFPIFEGANDVMRCFVALSGLKPVGERLSELDDLSLAHPIESIGLLLEYVADHVADRIHPDRITHAHPDVQHLADPITEQVQRLAGTSESLLRKYRSAIADREFQLKRLHEIVSDIYAQVCVLSRVTSLMSTGAADPSDRERFIAETFCRRAVERVENNLRVIEDNDDERVADIARAAYKIGKYGYELYDE
jgi:acyl-CoA dehydrogenase family protein 9